MRLIDGDAVIALIATSIFDLEYNDENVELQKAITLLPTIEAEPIVRCKDCKHFYTIMTARFRDGSTTE